MSSFHVVYIPIEWNVLSIKALRYIIKVEILANFRKNKKIEGTVIVIANVVARLERHQNSIWMKRCNDKRSCPYYNDYDSIFVSCTWPDIVSMHKTIYVVPREWQQYQDLECALWKYQSQHYSKYGNTEGFGLTIDGVTAYVKNYRNQSWLKKNSDFNEKPDRKSYSSIFVPCVYCNRV